MARQQRHLSRDDTELRPAWADTLLGWQRASEHFCERAAELEIDLPTGFVFEDQQPLILASIDQLLAGAKNIGQRPRYEQVVPRKRAIASFSGHSRIIPG
jgi:hypothetical protein